MFSKLHTGVLFFSAMSMAFAAVGPKSNANENLQLGSAPLPTQKMEWQEMPVYNQSSFQFKMRLLKAFMANREELKNQAAIKNKVKEASDQYDQ